MTNPKVTVVSHLSWPEVSIPQTAIPVTINGHRYLVEVDEFARQVSSDPKQPVGAARIIDIADDTKPRVVSNIRLEVNQPAARNGAEKDDPGANSGLQGYAGHYCSVPRRDDPRVVACSMILSGLRVFDIRRLRNPVEVAYFNKPLPGTRLDNPTAQGAFAMSQPAWDVRRRSIWYTDGNTGFYDVRLTNGVGRLLRR